MASRNLPTLLTTIADELRPEPERIVEAERRAKTLIAELKDLHGKSPYHVHEYVAHGSHARDTAVLGFKDIDYLLVLDPEALKDGGRRTPSPNETVRGMAEILRKLRGGLVAQGTVEVREQDHSIGVKYPNSKLRIDFVPALRTGEKGCFRIPDLGSKAWIKTRPHLLKRHVSLAEHKNPHLRRVIRVVKGWRRARGKVMRIPSYAVELLLAEWANERARFESLVRYFFTRLSASRMSLVRLVML